MAVRLRNTGTKPLRVDLVEGESLLLAPGRTSPPLREEDLYSNAYLDDWERAGLVMRVPVAMERVLEWEQAETPVRARVLRRAAAMPAPAPEAAQGTGEDVVEEDAEDAAEEDAEDAAQGDAVAGADVQADTPYADEAAGVDAAEAKSATTGKAGRKSQGAKGKREP